MGDFNYTIFQYVRGLSSDNSKGHNPYYNLIGQVSLAVFTMACGWIAFKATFEEMCLELKSVRVMQALRRLADELCHLHYDH